MVTLPLFVKVGFCTHNEAHLLAVFDRSDDKDIKTARLAYKVEDDESDYVDVELKPAPPYALAQFDLTGLPSGKKVTYGAVAANDTDLFDDAESILASGKTRQFRLLPTGRPLRIALLSCNKVRKVDVDERYALWEHLKKQVDNEEVDLIIHAGDQIYADPIKKEAKADPYKAGWSAAKSKDVIDILSAKYRYYYVQNWEAEAVSGVLGSCPSIMTWDDHDVYDGYGSNANDDSKFCRTLFEAAHRAFVEFQASTNPPSFNICNSYACGFVHNDEIGFLTLDTRKNRMYKESRVLGRRQMEDVDEWLTAQQKKNLKHLFVVSSIPFVHVKIDRFLKILELTPRLWPFIDDIRDCWVADRNKPECREILALLFEFMKNSPNTMVTVLGGDVHVSSLARIVSHSQAHKHPNGTDPSMYQVVSSGIGHPPPYRIIRLYWRIGARSTVNLSRKIIQGKLLPIDGAPGKPRILERRNFAILRPGEAVDGEHAHRNLQVEYFAEEKEGIGKYEQCLFG